MTTTRDELRKLAENATEGPWEKVADHRESRVVATGGEHWLWVADTGSVDSSHAQKDAEFIATARTALPALLDQLDAAEARIKAVQDVLDQHEAIFGDSMGVPVDRIRCALGTAT